MRTKTGKIIGVIVATVITLLTLPVVHTGAQAQTLPDCNEYTSDGKWDLAAESCLRVIYAIQSVRQSQVGEYCDNCEHSLAEIPDPLDSVKMTAVYARAAENEGIAEMHRGHYSMAQFWFQQSNYNAKVLAMMRSGSALMQQYVPIGRAIERETDELLAAVKPHVSARAKHSAKVARTTPAPRCAHPNQNASIVKAMSPEYPDSARDLGLGPVTVLVNVTVDPSGEPWSVYISKSSGNSNIDAQALLAARGSTYSPKYQNCKAVRASYLFRAEFDPN